MSDLAAGIPLVVVNGLIVAGVAKLFEDRIERRFAEFQARLDREAFEHETRFGKLHEERARTITELYKLLVRAERSLDSLDQVVGRYVDEEIDAGIEERLRETRDTLVNFGNFYDERALFFPRLCNQIERLIDAWNQTYISLAFAESARRHDDQEVLAKELIRAFETQCQIVPPLKAAIESEFRVLLGVNSSPSTAPH